MKSTKDKRSIKMTSYRSQKLISIASIVLVSMIPGTQAESMYRWPLPTVF